MAQVIGPLVFLPLPYASPIHHPKSAILAGADSLTELLANVSSIGRAVSCPCSSTSMETLPLRRIQIVPLRDLAIPPFGQGSRWGVKTSPSLRRASRPSSFNSQTSRLHPFRCHEFCCLPGRRNRHRLEPPVFIPGYLSIFMTDPQRAVIGFKQTGQWLSRSSGVLLSLKTVKRAPSNRARPL